MFTLLVFDICVWFDLFCYFVILFVGFTWCLGMVGYLLIGIEDWLF